MRCARRSPTAERVAHDGVKSEEVLGGDPVGLNGIPQKDSSPKPVHAGDWILSPGLDNNAVAFLDEDVSECYALPCCDV